MASIKFYLKEPKAEKSSIFFLLHYGAYKIERGKKKYLPLKYGISESINPAYWNSKTGRVKQDRRFKQHPEFNARLQFIEDESLSALRRLLNDKADLSPDLLRDELDKILRPGRNQTAPKNTVFLNFFEHYLEASGIKASTQKTYRQTLRDITEYQDESNKRLLFNDIDIDFHDLFIKFLKGKNYSANTIGDRIKVVKTLMRAAHERGLHNNTDYQKKAFSKPREETRAVYLNDKELYSLYKLDLSNDGRLSNVRDWFLIASYTGLRYSDFSRVTIDNIKDDTITIVTQKTGAEVVIPLHTVVKSILDKHDYNLPKAISNQKFNKYIKEICKLAKIDETIMIEETKGDLKVSVREKKHNLISAHTARRSFATNAFIAGVPSIQIMKLTGHKTEKIFMNYIKISAEENAEKLKTHEFFNKMIAK